MAISAVDIDDLDRDGGAIAGEGDVEVLAATIRPNVDAWRADHGIRDSDPRAHRSEAPLENLGVHGVYLSSCRPFGREQAARQ